MTGPFPCTSCGACCRRISLAVKFHHVQDPDDPLFFPYKWDSAGVCEMLLPGNLCAVYRERPLICNVERYAEHIGADRDSFFRVNISACNRLMDEDRLAPHLRINTDDKSLRDR